MKEALRSAIEKRGYTTLTPVQDAVAKPELEGRDLLVSAQTGSGKTLGFGIAISSRLLGDDETFGSASAPLALVIAPTRELAMQVMRELSWLYAEAGAVVTSCVGGMDMRDERRALGRGAHIVVATPGRLRDHITRGSIDLGSIRAVVLDEADEMLDLGFREDLEFILGEAPADRQTLMFSATVPASIAELAKQYQRNAERVVTKSEKSQHADIDYRAMLVAERDTENAVINTLRFFEAPNAIVFANTRATVNRLTTRLSNRGFQVVALSGELSQTERTHALQAMRDGRARVCVATDVAARGIDLPNLDLVVHAELPSNHETLLHRSGRTGRAGRKGVSALIVTGKSRKKAERILGMARLKADWAPAPSADAVIAMDEERLLAHPDWQLEITEEEQPGIAALMDKFSPELIAAAYLRLFKSSRSAPEDLQDPDAKAPPRPAFGPSVWFSVSGGRQTGAEPRRILPMLCTAGGLDKDDIGAIRVQDTESFVEIRQASARAFLDRLGPGGVIEEGVKVTPLDSAPEFTASGRPAPRSKPAERPHFDKPNRSGPGGPRKPRTDRFDRDGDGGKPAAPEGRKPRHKKDNAAADGPAERPAFAKPGKKGPPPPKSKASSKKNRTRAVTAKAGQEPPRRPKPGPRKPKD